MNADRQTHLSAPTISMIILSDASIDIRARNKQNVAYFLTNLRNTTYMTALSMFSRSGLKTAPLKTAPFKNSTAQNSAVHNSAAQNSAVQNSAAQNCAAQNSAVRSNNLLVSAA